MPYLMLSFEAVRDEDIAIYPVGKSKTTRTNPTGAERIKMTMIDTDTGKVVEFDAEAHNVKQIERAPKWAETHTAGQVLGKDPGKNVDLEAFRALEAERDSYRQKHLSAQETIRQKDDRIISLTDSLAELRKRDLNEESRHLLAASLDIHISELALSQNFEAYERAKKLYKALTGKAWVDEGSDDDDEEEDPSFHYHSIASNFGLLSSDRMISVLWDSDHVADPIADLKDFQRRIAGLEDNKYKFTILGESDFKFIEDVDMDFSNYFYNYLHLGRRLGSTREIMDLQRKIQQVGENLNKFQQQIARKSKKMTTKNQQKQWRSDERNRSRRSLPGR